MISNESGEGGAAISRREYGERTKDLNRSFPHWFDGNFKKYSDHEDQMPFDSHYAAGAHRRRAGCTSRAPRKIAGRIRGANFWARSKASARLGTASAKGHRHGSRCQGYTSPWAYRRISHPRRQARRHGVRLGAVSEIRRYELGQTSSRLPHVRP